MLNDKKKLRKFSYTYIYFAFLAEKLRLESLIVMGARDAKGRVARCDVGDDVTK